MVLHRYYHYVLSWRVDDKIYLLLVEIHIEVTVSVTSYTEYMLSAL
jgi:hypothetical protein